MSAFHCDKLCGCDACEPLVFALNIVASDPISAANFATSKAPGDDNGLREWCAVNALADPAKLAELMASALRARGLWKWSASMSIPTGAIMFDVIARVDGAIRCELWDCRKVRSFRRELSMVEFRTRLLAIMQTTANESSREACERILRGDNSGPFAVDAWPNEDEVA